MSGRTDVVVIGGGPAGSAAATMLARAGWQVVVLEREHFPREHVGESLLPASMPILETLGVLPEMEAAGFLKKWGATMVWGTGRDPWSWHFRETNVRYPHAYQVWRADFDAILLRNAARTGADVREGRHVAEVVFDGDRASGVRFFEPDGSTADLSARFVVDASGQAGMIARARRLRENDEHFRNLAVYRYFDGARRLPEPNETNIFIESYEHGWLWNIPLHNGWMSVGAVVDAAAAQEHLAALGADGFLDAQIAAAPETAGMLSAARPVADARVVRDWSYVASEVTGSGWVIAGDAACFIDPLFSTGVHLALSAGVMAASFVTTALRDPELARASAPVYRDLYYEQYSHFRELARLFYASNRSVDSYFWEVRRVLEDDSLTPREAFVRATAGQSAKGYERVVLEHGDLPADFVAEVSALERDYAARGAAINEAIASRAILGAHPVAGPGVTVERRPVLGTEQFSWGLVLVTPARPAGVEVSELVRRLVALSDGSRTVADVVRELGAGSPDERLLSAVVQALQVLYTDGALDLR